MNNRKLTLKAAIVNDDYRIELSDYEHYIGLEWSKSNMAVARLTQKRNTNSPQIIESGADIKELKLYLSRLEGKKILTIEETTTSHWLYVELLEYVDRIVICDPYRNRLLSDGAKNDKIDAGKLCLLLKGGMIREVFHTTDKIYKLRKYVSAYEDLIKYGVRLLNQKWALRLSQGIVSRREIKSNDKITSFIEEKIDKAIEVYQENKEEYHQLFKKISRQEKIVRNQLTIPGIGEVSAVKIVSTVVDAQRFKTAGHYLVYCGLVKHEKLSGVKVYGKRKPRYNRTMKAAYKTAAMAALRSDNPIREYYEYLLGKGVAEHNARNATARYIAKISYGMLKNGGKYQPYRWRKTHSKED